MKQVTSILLTFLLLFISACKDQEEVWQGYVEGETLLLSAPVSGSLEKLFVRLGQQLSVDDPLFQLDPQPEAQTLANAEAQLKIAIAESADLQKGHRPEEIQVIEAQFEQAKAAATLSAQQLQRTQSLVQRNLASKEALDEVTAQVSKDQNRINEIKAQLEAARLAARTDQQNAALAKVEAAQANLEIAKWKLNEKIQYAKKSARVEDIFFHGGEFIQAGTPVMSVLPDDGIKVRFFVQQDQISRLKQNDSVLIRCDGCQQEFSATINFISSQLEYTPPFIYSKENRSKFVYLVEAIPNEEEVYRLNLGQPVDVMLSSALDE